MNRSDVFSKEKIIAFIDNDMDKWNKKINNILIVPPNNINEYSFDKIIIMSRKTDQMEKQLISDLGIDKTLILDFEDYCEYNAHNQELYKLVIHYKNTPLLCSNNKPKILIITYALNYNGGSLAAFYAALALKEKGFEVVIAARKADNHLIKEIVEMDITLFIQELIDFCKWDQVRWIEQFDYVIVNTLQQWRIIRELINRKPIFWWIHESKIEYDYLENSIINNIDNMKIETYVVSDVALYTFNQYFSNINAKILHYGIPDKGFDNNQFINKGKTIFAIIGSIVSIKAHDIFLTAIKHLTQDERNKSEFWLIGACPPENQFGISVLKEAEDIPEVKWLGELNREEIEKVYKDIDIVVVPSRQDSLPIVATEAFMYGKIVIASNVIGTAKYIEDKNNGLIFENENIDELTKKLAWVLNNKYKLNAISVKARQIYEQHYTLKIFGDRIEEILKNLR